MVGGRRPGGAAVQGRGEASRYPSRSGTRGERYTGFTTLEPKKAGRRGTRQGQGQGVRQGRPGGGLLDGVLQGLNQGTRHGGRHGGSWYDGRRGELRYPLDYGRPHRLPRCAYYQPHYSRYHYCRPYRHYYVRHRLPRHYYVDSSYYGYFGLGYYPTYGYVGFGSTYPTSYWYDYPASYDGYATYYRDADLSYDQDVYYTTNNYYVTQEAAPATVQGDGGVGYISDYGPPVGDVSAPQATTEIMPMQPVGEAESQVDTGPAPEPTLVDFGNAAFNAGDYEGAVRYYVGAVLADDNDGVARLFYGLTQFALGDYDLSAMGMRRALGVLPELIDRPIDLRSLYPDAESFEAQLEKLVSFVKEHKDARNALFTLGYVYYATAQPGLATETMRKLTDLDPKDELAIKVRDAAAKVIAQDSSL
jgi:tetratricopeptide (TPR) repeat protein